MAGCGALAGGTRPRGNIGTVYSILTSFAMFMLVEFLKINFGTTLINMVIYIIVAVIFYFTTLYLNGLLKNELNEVIKIIKKIKKRGKQ